MQIIDSVNDGTAQALIGEEIFSLGSETGNWIYHEITLVVGKFLIPLQLHEIGHVMEVLAKARDEARERRKLFYSQEDLSLQTA